MSTVALLAEVKCLGIKLWVEGEKLLCEPASALPAELKASLKEHKAEVKAALQAESRAIPATVDEVRCWIGCLREMGCIIRPADGVPVIDWPLSVDTPGRQREWEANIEKIAAVLEAEEERRAIQEVEWAAEQQHGPSASSPHRLIGCGFPAYPPSPAVPAALLQTNARCPKGCGRFVLPELRNETGDLCWPCAAAENKARS
jgi:TubC N-terminal docking domain